jgi:hypothetical protein
MPYWKAPLPPSSQAGAFESLAATANSIQLATDFRGELAALREEGAITTVEWLGLLNTLSQSGAAAAEVELAGIIMRDSLTDTDDEINQSIRLMAGMGADGGNPDRLCSADGRGQYERHFYRAAGH